MILTLIFTAFFGFVNFVLNLLPTATLDPAIGSGLTNFMNYIYQFNGFFPIDTALLLVKYAVAFWLLIFGWDVLQWLVELVRGK